MLEDLFDVMPQLGWTARPDGLIDYYNRGWYEYTGTTPERMKEAGWQAVHDPAHLATVTERWQRAVAAGEPVELEFPLRRWDGAFRWFLTRVRPIRDESGTLVKWVGINTDIQDQRSAHERLQQQRAQYLALLSQAPVAIGLLTGPTHIVELANPLLCQLWGRRPEHVLGKPVGSISPEFRDQGFVALLSEVFRTGVAHVGSEMPAQLDRKGDGTLETLFFNVVYEPMRNEAGVVDGVTVVAIDVSNQVAGRDSVVRRARQAEFAASVGRALTGGEPLPAQLTRCCEAMVQLGASFARIWVHNETSGVLELRASAGLYTHLDGPHSRVPVGHFKIGRIAAERQPHLTNHVFDDPRVSDPEWARREGLTAFAGYPMMLGDRLIGVMALFAREPLNSETLQALSTVASQIALAVEREQIEHFRELFIGMLGHDLRNPLSAMLMGAQVLIANPEVPDRPRRTAERMRRSAHRMSRMVDQLLDYARARSAGGIPLVPVSADLVAICREAIVELQQASPDRTIDLHITAAGTGEWDEDRMEQVFSNLLGNALTYGKADENIRVTFGGNASEIVCEILSFSEPIPPDALPHIFDPFRRGTHPGTATTMGLGLGLFITREIIQAHGGTIGVTSSQTDGTSFVFVVPRRRVQLKSTPGEST